MILSTQITNSSSIVSEVKEEQTTSTTHSRRSTSMASTSEGNSTDIQSTKARTAGVLAIPEGAPLSPPIPQKRAMPNPAAEEERDSKRTEISYSPEPQTLPTASDHPATEYDRASWQGFCDIESDPAYFSVILREIGVQGVTVREVFAMTPGLLEMLPQPIYGLILLFRYREFGNSDQAPECPQNVWFANQLPAQNSCGTLAMTNILMNATEVHVGEHLEQFKDFTQSFSPYQRGEAFASFDHVKRIHNSFAKKMDLLENDKHLASKANRTKTMNELTVKPKKKTTKRRNRRGSEDSVATVDSAEQHEENSHHFIAFVPSGDEVWKLDGYDAQPTSMGSFDAAAGETWLSNVSDTIATLMAAGDDEYGVIALTQSPLLTLRKQASLALNTLNHVEARLDIVDQGWKSFVAEEDIPLSSQMLGVEDQLAMNPISDDVTAKIDAEQMADLLDRRNRLTQELSKLAASIMVEIQEEAEQDLKAEQRRYDSGPVIKKWLEMLAENGYLEENLERFMPANGKKSGR